MDVGAFLGYYACYVSSLFGGKQEVYAIESNPLYADAIRESARLNKFSNLQVFQAALSDRVEHISIDGLAGGDVESRAKALAHRRSPAGRVKGWRSAINQKVSVLELDQIRQRRVP